MVTKTSPETKSVEIAKPSEPKLEEKPFHQPQVELSIETLIQSLTNIETKEKIIQQLDAQIAKKSGELHQLISARDALSPSQVSTFNEKPQSSVESGKFESGKKIGRPKGTSPKHNEAILNVLKNEKTGLTIADLHEKLNSSGHSIDRKNLSTYVSNLATKDVIQKIGDRGDFKYKVKR